MSATIHAHNELPNGTAAQGQVVVTVNTDRQVIRNPAGNIVFQGPATITLVDGEATFTLPGSNDGTLEPSGFTFTATEQLKHVSAADYRVVQFQTTNGQTHHLADFASTEEVAEDPSYGANLNGLTARVATLEEGGVGGDDGEVDIPIYYATDYGVDFGGFHGSFPTFNPTIATANTAALNECLADAAAHALFPEGAAGMRYGAIVQLPAGVALINDTIEMAGGIWLRGAGVGLTELVGMAWETNPDPVLRLSHTNALAKVSDLAIAVVDADFGLPTAHGIHVMDNDQGGAYGQLGGQITTIEDVVVVSAPGNGINLGGIENRLINCYVARCGSEGIRVANTDNMLWGCTSETNVGAGFAIATPNNKIFGCKAFGNGGSGFNIGGQRNMLTACEAQDNAAYGFNDSVGDNSYAACEADSNGTAGGTSYGFRLVGGSVAAACVAIIRTGSEQTWAYGAFESDGAVPQISGTSRLPHTGHIDPASVGDININNVRGTQSIAYSATITPDVYKGGTVLVGTLTGNLTINAPQISGKTAANSRYVGQRVIYKLTQDATGGRTVTFSAAYTLRSTIDTDPDAVTTVEFMWDGTTWSEMGVSGVGGGGGGGAEAVTGLLPRKVISGRYAVCTPGAGLNGMNIDEGYQFTFPFEISTETTLTHLCLSVDAVDSAAVIRLGVREDAGGLPGDLLASAATIDASTATGTTGLKEAAFAQTLLPGIYWAVCRASGGTPNVRGHSGLPVVISSTSGAGSANNALSGYNDGGGGTGALATSWGSTYEARINVPRIVMKIA